MGNPEIFTEIETLIRKGAAKKARDLISSYKRKRKLKPLERVRFARWYRRIKEISAAFDTLGRQLSPIELKLASKEVLAIQLTLGDLFRHVGARYLALKIFSDIEAVLKKRNIKIEDTLPEYTTYRADLFLAGCEYKKALKELEKIRESRKHDSYRHNLAGVSVADALEGCGQSQKAVDIVSLVLQNTNDNETVLKAICHEARGEYLFRAEKTGPALDDFNRAESLFADKKTADYARLLQWRGAVYVAGKKYDPARQDLKAALEIYHYPNAQPQPLIATFYWLGCIPGEALTLAQKVAIRAHPCFNYYSYLAGKSIESHNNDILHPWVRKKCRPTINNVWRIGKDSINAENYRVITDTDDVIDLFSGFMKIKGRITVLTTLQLAFLTALFGAGDCGLNKWALYDYIYREKYFDPDASKAKLKKLSDGIQKLGIRVKNNQNLLKITRYPAIIIIPMEPTKAGLYNYLFRQKPEFTSQDVTGIFAISKRTANTYIQEWLEKAVIRQEGSGSNTRYRPAINV